MNGTVLPDLKVIEIRYRCDQGRRHRLSSSGPRVIPDLMERHWIPVSTTIRPVLCILGTTSITPDTKIDARDRETALPGRRIHFQRQSRSILP